MRSTQLSAGDVFAAPPVKTPMLPDGSMNLPVPIVRAETGPAGLRLRGFGRQATGRWIRHRSRRRPGRLQRRQRTAARSDPGGEERPRRWRRTVDRRHRERNGAFGAGRPGTAPAATGPTADRIVVRTGRDERELVGRQDIPAVPGPTCRRGSGTAPRIGGQRHEPTGSRHSCTVGARLPGTPCTGSCAHRAPPSDRSGPLCSTCRWADRAGSRRPANGSAWRAGNRRWGGRVAEVDLGPACRPRRVAGPRPPVSRALISAGKITNACSSDLGRSRRSGPGWPGWPPASGTWGGCR